MIGEIRKVFLSYFDVKTNKNSFKSRPALIIAKADDTDYVVLPVSSITRRENVNALYDVEVDPAVYPLLGLRNLSFVRTHKQTIANLASIGDMIGDMKGSYEDLYLEILEKRAEFSKNISDQAI